MGYFDVMRKYRAAYAYQCERKGIEEIYAEVTSQLPKPESNTRKFNIWEKYHETYASQCERNGAEEIYSETSNQLAKPQSDAEPEVEKNNTKKTKNKRKTNKKSGKKSNKNVEPKNNRPAWQVGEPQSKEVMEARKKLIREELARSNDPKNYRSEEFYNRLFRNEKSATEVVTKKGGNLFTRINKGLKGHGRAALIATALVTAASILFYNVGKESGKTQNSVVNNGNNGTDTQNTTDTTNTKSSSKEETYGTITDAQWELIAKVINS